MGSTRLPGKVLLDLGGGTVLGRVVRRMHRARLVNEIVVATTTSAADDDIVRECRRLGVRWFRGSETDVLDRYFRAVTEYAIDVVVRITADCPVIDPGIVDETIQMFLDKKADYASNGLRSTYPRGLDTEVFSSMALAKAWREAGEAHQREHVTPYFYEHPELFCIASLENKTNESHHRWTLDTYDDLRLLRQIYFHFSGEDDFGWQEVLQFMQREPHLAELNSHVAQKALYAD